MEYHNSSEEESGAEMERASRLLANSLRKVAQKTTAANIRNWCLTHALELEDHNLERHRRHRFSRSVVMSNPASSTVHALSSIKPRLAEGFCQELRWGLRMESTDC